MKFHDPKLIMACLLLEVSLEVIVTFQMVKCYLFSYFSIIDSLNIHTNKKASSSKIDFTSTGSFSSTGSSEKVYLIRAHGKIIIISFLKIYTFIKFNNCRMYDGYCMDVFCSCWDTCCKVNFHFKLSASLVNLILDFSHFVLDITRAFCQKKKYSVLKSGSLFTDHSCYLLLSSRS